MATLQKNGHCFQLALAYAMRTVAYGGFVVTRKIFWLTVIFTILGLW